MPLKTVKRVTFSLPRATLIKLESRIPKNKRSKFIADLIEQKCKTRTEEISFEEYCRKWDELAKKCPRKGNKTAVEMQREDRLSH